MRNKNFYLSWAPVILSFDHKMLKPCSNEYTVFIIFCFLNGQSIILMPFPDLKYHCYKLMYKYVNVYTYKRCFSIYLFVHYLHKEHTIEISLVSCFAMWKGKPLFVVLNISCSKSALLLWIFSSRWTSELACQIP